MTEKLPDGRRRLDVENDIVRLEITTAFRKGVNVLPILVEEASMPLTESLPDILKHLTRINAFEIQPKRFQRDVTELLNMAEAALKKAEERRKASPNLELQISNLEQQKQQIDERLEKLRKEYRAEVFRVEEAFQETLTRGGPSFDEKGNAERPFAAFLLYSHKADGNLAPAIQSGLQTFGQPWYALRKVRVFRDQSNLAASSSLWADLTLALDRAKFLVLLASEDAAKSPWVCRELEYWLQHRNKNRILIVLTSGEIIWDRHSNDFDWSRTTALPQSLKGVFDSEPLYVDLSWAGQSSEVMTLSNFRFREAIANLAATIRGVCKDELIGEEVRQHRRVKSLVWLGVSSILLLSMALVATLYKLGLGG